MSEHDVAFVCEPVPLSYKIAAGTLRAGHEAGKIHVESRSMTLPTNVHPQIWVVALAATIAVVILSHCYPGFFPRLNPDSYQYLSVADNALSGRLGFTSLPHFDAERSLGVVPAPMVTFPSGYPLLIAAAALGGIGLERAAFVVSAASAMLALPLMFQLAGLVGLPTRYRLLVTGLFALNSSTLIYAATANSESTFTLVAVAATGALLVSRSVVIETRLRWSLVAGLLFGFGYWVRYAGLFLVAGVALILARDLLGRKRREIVGSVITLAAAIALVGAGMVRNILIVGNWRGGNEKAVENPILELGGKTLWAINQLFMGSTSCSETHTCTVRLALVLIASAVVLWAVRGRTWRHSVPKHYHLDLETLSRRTPSLDLLTLTLTYSACMFYVARITVITYDSRLFLPVLPFLLILAASLWHRLVGASKDLPRWLPIVGVLSLAMYVGLNLTAFFATDMRGAADSVRVALGARVASNESARSVVKRLAGESGVVLATNGQPIGYWLGNPTISLVPPQFARTIWDESTVRREMDRYSASILIIAVPGQRFPDNVDIVPSAFIRHLADGYAPHWLHEAYRSPDLAIFYRNGG
jgi:hypothetical protein